jgi:hypothetical protein
MDDLTIIKACAEASGTDVEHRKDAFGERYLVYIGNGYSKDYNPLTDDAQAMALVKTLRIDCTWYAYQNVWCATAWADDLTVEKEVFDPDLNRAICLAVAMRGKE